MPIKRTCKTCGKKFNTQLSYILRGPTQALHCSPECASSDPDVRKRIGDGKRGKRAHNYSRVEVVCVVCGKHRMVPRCHKTRYKCCSFACSAIHKRLPRPKGYKRTTVNGERLEDHKIVVRNILGPAVYHGKVIHHIDGDRFNNAPDNLIVVTNGQHFNIHSQKVRYGNHLSALDIIKKWPESLWCKSGNKLSIKKLVD